MKIFTLFLIGFLVPVAAQNIRDDERPPVHDHLRS